MYILQNDGTGRSVPNVREQILCFNFLLPQELCQGRSRRGLDVVKLAKSGTVPIVGHPPTVSVNVRLTTPEAKFGPR